MKDKIISCRKLVIETDGTTSNTFIKVDDQVLGYIDMINFNADVNKHELDIMLIQNNKDSYNRIKLQFIK